MRRWTFCLLLCSALPWQAAEAQTIDELEALTDEAIQSACHGYVLHDLAQRLAGWFGSDSPLCSRVNAGEAPRSAIAALREQGLTTAPRTGTADFRALPDSIAMECDNDARCMIERRRARDTGHPLDMATFTRVRRHCEQTVHRVYGVPQGVDGCIEQALADWPQLRLTRPVRLLPMQGDFEVTASAPLLEAPEPSAPTLAQLEARRPLAALARSEDGRWLQVRDQLSGAVGFVAIGSVQRARPEPAAISAETVTSAPPPSLDIDALVRSGQISRQHQINEMERIEQARREEEARLAAERERLAREQAERERIAALQRQRQQQQQQAAAQQRSGADSFMRGLAGAAVVGLGAAAVSRGVPMDQASQVVASGITDIMSEGQTQESLRVLQQAQQQSGSAGSPIGGGGTSGSGGQGGVMGGGGSGAGLPVSVQVRSNAFDAAGRPSYRNCSTFSNPTGYDALYLSRQCNAAEQQYREYERLARSGADAATVERAWEAHRSTAVNFMVFIDSQATAKRANGF